MQRYGIINGRICKKWISLFHCAKMSVLEVYKITFSILIIFIIRPQNFCQKVSASSSPCRITLLYISPRSSISPFPLPLRRPSKSRPLSAHRREGPALAISPPPRLTVKCRRRVIQPQASVIPMQASHFLPKAGKFLPKACKFLPRGGKLLPWEGKDVRQYMRLLPNWVKTPLEDIGEMCFR